MDHLVPMHVLYGVEDLLDRLAHEGFLALELLHESAVAGVLHHEEDVVLVLEVAVQFDDVGVVEAIVNLQLSCKLLFHLVVLDGRLEDFLDGAHESCTLVNAQIDVPKLTRTDAFS